MAETRRRKRVTVLVSAEQFGQLERLARDAHRPVSAIVAQLLTQALARWGERPAGARRGERDEP